MLCDMSYDVCYAWYTKNGSRKKQEHDGDDFKDLKILTMNDTICKSRWLEIVQLVNGICD